MPKWKRIPLTQNKVTTVNEKDFVKLNTWGWYAKFMHGYYYAARYTRREGTVYMHRVILGLKPGDGIEGDHINGNSLDNRRSNLRKATHTVNQSNRKDHSKYGVGVRKIGKRYQARAQLNKHSFSGMFDTPREARTARKNWKEIYSDA